MRRLFSVLCLFCLFLVSKTYANCYCSPNWCGFYVGLNAGGAFGHARLRTTTVTGSYFGPLDEAQIGRVGTFRVDPKGFTGGVQVGYNYNLCRWILGLETEFDAFLLKRSREVTEVYDSAPPSAFTITQEIRTHWLFTLRPRLGWSVCSWLFYGTGGLALTDIKYRARFTDNFGANAFEDTSRKEVKAGWIVGAGAEYAFSCCLSAKLEYLYTSFGEIKKDGVVVAVGFDPNPIFHKADLSAHIVRVGINWRL